MFRKNAEEALAEWSEENVALCAERQSGILACAKEMLAEGGNMVYSTCTFSEEEDEAQVEGFADKFPEMQVLRTEKLYPHKIAGEGHFAALFSKNDGGRGEMKPFKSVCSPASAKVYREFEKELFSSYRARNLHEVNGVIYSLPDKVFDFKGLNVLRVGLKLGEVKNGRFEPAHALAMALPSQGVTNVCDLALEDERTQSYLRGDTIDVDGKNGWCVVCVDGYPLGWGKRVNGTVKNHYPKGLRNSK
jgi:NOL1/NOP2/fmu family ribosome biogenesis protein